MRCILPARRPSYAADERIHMTAWRNTKSCCAAPRQIGAFPDFLHIAITRPPSPLTRRDSRGASEMSESLTGTCTADDSRDCRFAKKPEPTCGAYRPGAVSAAVAALGLSKTWVRGPARRPSAGSCATAHQIRASRAPNTAHQAPRRWASAGRASTCVRRGTIVSAKRSTVTAECRIGYGGRAEYGVSGERSIRAIVLRVDPPAPAARRSRPTDLREDEHPRRTPSRR